MDRMLKRRLAGLNPSTHIIRSLSCPQGVLALTFDESDFHIVNSLLMIHRQNQGFAVGV